MQVSQAPTSIVLPWAAGATSPYSRVVPVPSQIGIQNGAASWTDGWPPLTFQPVAAGGIPPFGADCNGGLNQISGGVRWFQAGGPVIWNATFSAAVGGYPAGSVVQDPTNFGTFWFSTVDNNTSTPGSSATWIPVPIGISNLAIYTNVGGTQYISVNGATPTTSGAGVFAFGPRAFVQGLWAGGAGAGGGSGTGSCPSGGGAGAFCMGLITDISGSVTVTVGAAGAGGSNSPTNGTAGGASSFGSYMTAAGGSPGIAESGGGVQLTSGNGGTGSIGLGTAGFTAPGTAGGTGYQFGDVVGGDTQDFLAATGGYPWGATLPGVVHLTQTNVSPYGPPLVAAGGCAGVGSHAGGAGGPGMIIVMW